MSNKNLILIGALCVALMFAASSGCKSEDGQTGLQSIEQMSDVDYSKWKLYIQLGVKIGANHLLQDKSVSQEELTATASVIESVRDQTIVPGTQSLIGPALEKAGLTNDEVQLLLVVVEQELKSRGALDWIDPTTGTVSLSPRTKELLTIVANSLRSAIVVPQAEAQQGKELQKRFNGKLITAHA